MKQSSKMEPKFGSQSADTESSLSAAPTDLTGLPVIVFLVLIRCLELG
jgi:hypothetical protein